MNKLYFNRFFFLFLLFTACLINAQVNKEALLKDTRELHKKAIDAAANVFSTSEFKKGAGALADAEDYAKDPSEATSMIEKLNTASENFKTAIENSKTLSASFTDLLKTRQLPLSIGIDISSMSQWKDGEDAFISAVDDFKDKDADGVKKYSTEAEKYYKEAELLAIMEKYHGRLVAAIAKADDEDVEAYAPVTFNKVKQFAKDIETILNGNRYDTLKARDLLNSASYELGHGQYMKRVFTNLKKEDKTFEDLQLMWEEPLAKIGSIFSIPRSFDKGFEEYTSNVVNNINSDKTKLAAAQKENETLTADLAGMKKSYEDTKALLAAGKQENIKLAANLDSLKRYSEALLKSRDELTVKIGSVEAEKSQYKTQVDVQQKLKDQIAAVTEMFLPSEAEINRNGDLISIRLLNLNFPAKQATIDPQYYNLLAKVQKAIKIFPGAAVVIEGHTDGQGDYKKNLETSQARANAVFQYLLATMGADSQNITVAGLGASKPIANNNTEEGRAKNRRIEIVINPGADKK